MTGPLNHAARKAGFLAPLQIDCVFDLSSDLPRSDVWLVVDLLRATTTLASFFEYGGKQCRLVEEVEEALSLKKVLGPGWILAGERNSLPPEGFDLGNSPRIFLSLDPQKWEGLILTTSNGTRGLLRAFRRGGKVFAACGRNAGAAAEKASASGKRITILCCGQNGKPALEDTLCAGLLVERLLSQSDRHLPGNGARKALAAWVDSGRTLEAAKESEHARRLLELGFSEDLDFCCQIDGFRSVPRLASLQGLMIP